MKEENWITNVNRVALWLEAEDRGQAGQAISLSITLGNDCGSDEMRSTYWTAIRSIGGNYDDFPLARKGRESSLSPEMQMQIDGVVSAVETAFAAITDAELIATVIHPHGRTGGGYDSIADLAADYANKAKQNLVKAAKDNRWDGTMNGNIPVMTPPPLKEKTEAQKD